MADCTKCANRNNDYCIFACENGESFKPITNADRIRAMSDEELAEFITPVKCVDCHLLDCGVGVIGDKRTCKERVLDWLRAEVDDGEQS